MKMKIFPVSVAGCLLIATGAQAGSMTSSAGRGTLVESSSWAPLVLGADYEEMKRTVVIKSGGSAELRARSTRAVIGVDVAPWLTLYTGLGRTEGRVFEPVWRGDDFTWSLGLEAGLWSTEIRDPKFMEGRFSIRLAAEYARMEFDETPRESADWEDIQAALLANYEIFVDAPGALEAFPYSLTLYAGPVLSRVDGTLRSAGDRRAFEQDRDVGLLFGADLALSRKLSVGYAGAYYEEYTHRVSVRFRF
jgi:hypothetical protein